MSSQLDFPLPPTTPPAPALAPAPPAVDELTGLRQRVAELEHVVALARTRVETLGGEKREALERALRLEAELEAAGRREAELRERLAGRDPDPPSFDERTLAELIERIAAVEAIVAPSRAA